MNYNILASGSTGNCIIVENFLMVDCGVSYKKIQKYLKQVKLIFISHIHSDHCNLSTITKIAFNFPNIKFVMGSQEVAYALLSSKIPSQNIFILLKDKWYDLGIVKVRLEQLQHDVWNYALKWEYKGKLGLYVVDTAKIDHIEAKNYDLYLIESNYREDILKRHIEECDDYFKLNYLQRVETTHLSYGQANSFLIENMGENSQFQYIHQSKYNFEEVNE